MNDDASLRDPVDEAAVRWGESYDGAPGFRALVSLVRGYSATAREIDRLLRPAGLNISRFEVLLLLSFTRAGAMPVMRIRDLLMVHGSSVTYLVDRLAEAGHVAREADPSDRRVSLVAITPEGRATVRRAAELVAASGFGPLAALGEDDLSDLGDLLGRLRPEAQPGG